MKYLAAVALLALTLVSCGPPSSTDLQDQQQDRLDQQAINSVGMPAITRFWEKRQLKTIDELRDQALATVTYLTDRQGHLHKLCDSVGYGIPYATQYTPPESLQWTHNGLYTLPQADPNGLYSPADAHGTWILCLDPKTKGTRPVYAEPDVVVSPFALHSE